MEQLLLNLAVNSREAMPRGGTLTIRIDEVNSNSQSWVRIVVSDTGEGIPHELIDQVFAPFFTTKDKGTGLGLATVHDIVEKHDGSVRVESEVGKGTVFEILLPASEGSEERSEPSLALITPRGCARVLLVEDHDVVRRTTRRLLEGTGYDVTTVSNGLEACSLIEGGALFDLIVSDVSMPVLDGTGMALRLNRQGCSTPILFVSGHVREIPAELFGLHIKTSFLGKPFSGDLFRQRVSQMLRGAALHEGDTFRSPPLH
jgi:two-component system cell cycle sensor histidine kinase/response regulator CckA